MPENNEKPLAKFDPSTLVEKLRDRMKGALVDLVPEEQWDAMIRKEIESFFAPPPPEERNRYNELVIRRGSPFQQAVHQVLADDARKRVIGLLSSPEWDGYWDSTGKRQVGDAVTDLVKVHGTEILNGLLASMVQNLVANLRPR